MRKIHPVSCAVDLVNEDEENATYVVINTIITRSNGSFAPLEKLEAEKIFVDSTLYAEMKLPARVSVEGLRRERAVID